MIIMVVLDYILYKRDFWYDFNYCIAVGEFPQIRIYVGRGGPAHTCKWGEVVYEGKELNTHGTY